MKSSQLFDSPLVAYEALKTGSSVTTTRHKTKVLKFFSLNSKSNLRSSVSDLVSLTQGLHIRFADSVVFHCHLYYQINTMSLLVYILFFKSESTGISNQPVFILKIGLLSISSLCTACLTDGVLV